MENIHFILKYHLLRQSNALVYLLCHEEYVTSFNKSSDLRNLVTNLQIYDSVSYGQDSIKNVKYLPAANTFGYYYINGADQTFCLNWWYSCSIPTLYI